MAKTRVDGDWFMIDRETVFVNSHGNLERRYERSIDAVFAPCRVTAVHIVSKIIPCKTNQKLSACRCCSNAERSDAAELEAYMHERRVDFELFMDSLTLV
jgi:hypothetical protein